MISRNTYKVRLEFYYFLIFGPFEFDKPNTDKEYYDKIRATIQSLNKELLSL